MKLKNIYTILFGIMLIFIVCGCTKPTESEKIFVSYYEDGQMIERKKYTTDDFSLLTLENKEGYTFIGWYLDESLETKFDEAKLAEYFKLGSIDLYACWELTKNNFTVNLHGLVNNKTVINTAFTNYQGSVVLEIVTPDLSTIYAYTLDLSTQKTGTFTINLSDFVSKSTQAKYTDQSLTWISFNFNDYAGGYILFDDCKLTK